MAWRAFRLARTNAIRTLSEDIPKSLAISFPLLFNRYVAMLPKKQRMHPTGASVAF